MTSIEKTNDSYIKLVEKDLDNYAIALIVAEKLHYLRAGRNQAALRIVE